MARVNPRVRDPLPVPIPANTLTRVDGYGYTAGVAGCGYTHGYGIPQTGLGRISLLAIEPVTAHVSLCLI
jgi:hypothetical protein